jgi:hypothetical protein
LEVEEGAMIDIGASKAPFLLLDSKGFFVEEDGSGVPRAFCILETKDVASLLLDI